jgi:pyruvate/2-oxoglutarate dehydrogenase complex dihydrolipoamide acyltransferase (E2) component
MKIEIRMPKLSGNMTSGVLTAWNKGTGDRISKGDVLFEVETDKVISEVESVEEGVLGAVYFQEGDVVNVDELVAVIEGE